MKRKTGNISIPGDVDVWPHEYQTAVALARAGYDVTFIKKSDEQHEHAREMKSIQKLVFVNHHGDVVDIK